MSEYSDLPDNIRRAIEDMLEKLSGMTPEEIFSMLSEILGEGGINEFTDLINTQEEFQIKIDHDDIEITEFMDDLEEIFYVAEYPEDEDIEPYYEICHIDGTYGEIIVEMPGLADDSFIDWYDFENEIFIHTSNAYENYKVAIPLPDYYIILEDQIDYRNGLLIIPFDVN